MKYVFLTDFHGTDLKKKDLALDRALHRLKPDVLCLLGDDDQTKTIYQLIFLENHFKLTNRTTLKVPGNHDHAILTNLIIDSEELNRQETTSSELSEKLRFDETAYRYIADLVFPEIDGQRNNPTEINLVLDEVNFPNQYKSVIIHGGYAGSLSINPDYPDEIKKLWFKLKTKTEHMANFVAMEDKNISLMIRGHNHIPSYVYQNTSVF